MDINSRLQQLKGALERNLIEAAEYARLKEELLSNFIGEENHPAAGASFTQGRGGYRPSDVTVLDTLIDGMEVGPADNRFRLVQRIGGGGMGQVWMARDLAEERVTGRECRKAIKLVHPRLQDHSPALKRLQKEAARAAALSHEGIVNVLGWRQGPDGWLFVVMEYLRGRDLAEHLHARGGKGLPVAEVCHLLRAVAGALDYAHRHNVLHRDLKPANVFLCEDGSIKLLDFGLAAELHTSASTLKVTDTSGTCVYMSPEAHHGMEPKVTRDIYAFACVACELLIGRPPLSCDAAVNRRAGPLRKPDQRLSDTLWNRLQRGLAYEPGERPVSAGELSEALIAVLDPSGQSAEAENARRSGSRRWGPVMAVTLVFGAGGLLWQLPEQPGTAPVVVDEMSGHGETPPLSPEPPVVSGDPVQEALPDRAGVIPATASVFSPVSGFSDQSLQSSGGKKGAAATMMDSRLRDGGQRWREARTGMSQPGNLQQPIDFRPGNDRASGSTGHAAIDAWESVRHRTPVSMRQPPPRRERRSAHHPPVPGAVPPRPGPGR